MGVNVTVEMSAYVCTKCGGAYCYPKPYNNLEGCPFCLMRTKNNLAAIIYEKDEEIDKHVLEKRALRGTITRLKNRLKKGATQ